jgi:hypothetical protein
VLSGTVIRANLEAGEIRENRPHALPPGDAVTPWFQPIIAGQPVKPTWNPGSTSFQSRNPQQLTFILGTGRNPVLVFEDPDSPAAGMSAYGGTSTVGFQAILSNLVGPGGTGVFSRVERPSVALPLAGNPDGSYYVEPQVTDRSLFDYRSQNLNGPNAYNNTDFTTYNVAFEQRFLENQVGFEAVYNRERLDNDYYSAVSSGRAYTLLLDVNTTLLDGTVNPNFGRPFVASAPERALLRTDRDDLRLTAYVDLDLRKKFEGRFAEWLGRHVLTGLYNESTDRVLDASSTYLAFSDSIYGNSLTGRIDGNSLPLTSLHYLGPSLASATSAAGAGATGMRATQPANAAAVGNGQFRMRGQLATSTFTFARLNITDDDSDFSQLAGGGNLTENDITS